MKGRSLSLIPKSIVNYVTGVSERSQQRCDLKDDGDMAEVSRSSVILEPTVIVRMGENNSINRVPALVCCFYCCSIEQYELLKIALILVIHTFKRGFFTMNQTLLSSYGTPFERVERALIALRVGQGVMVLDDENRENEGDMVFAAETMTVEQMALTIRHGSGIVCLCLTEERRQQLELPMMVENNSSQYQTAFTVTIEAAQGVTTGVSAADRITTIQAAIAEDAQPSDLNRPGHVFPLRAQSGGVLIRRGHTEATIDLVTMAGFKPAGVLCELTKDDGSMARAPEVIEFAKQHNMPIVTIEDLVSYRLKIAKAAS